MKTRIKRTLYYINNNRTSFLWAIAFILTVVSYLELSPVGSLDREVSRFESQIHRRQTILEEYAVEVLNSPDTAFIRFDQFPSDMVIYRYFNDTLQSWINQLPIANDDIDYFPFAYRMNHLGSRVVTNTPLAYLGMVEQYVSLGSAWYIVNVYVRHNQTIVAALMVQTDYPTENSVLTNRVNPNLSLRKQFSIVPVTFDESYIVIGKNGGVLFSVLKNLPGKAGESGLMLRWIAILFVVFALFSNLSRYRGIREFFLLLAGLIVVRFVAIYQSQDLHGEFEIFSPNLYADYGLFSSLGDLLINNSLIFLIILSLFLIRRTLAVFILKASPPIKRSLFFLFLLIPLALIPYIHYSFFSIIKNSNIVMEPFRIDEISKYTLLVYLSFSTLFLALLFSLQLLRPFISKDRRLSFFRRRALFAFISVISLYTLSTVSTFGYQKEVNRNRVWTTKMSVERDLNMELQLRSFELFIENDPIIALWIRIDQSMEILTSRLTEAYFWSLLQKYDMRLTVCDGNTMLVTDISNQDAPTEHCHSFYETEIARYGMQLGERSRFYFMNNYNGRISYLGVFPYHSFGKDVRLYIELDSKFLRESIGYPDLLIDHTKIDSYNIPSGYSYGKYLNERLVSYGGNFNYPIYNQKEYKTGYQTERSEGYIHFIHKITDENLIVMSRPERSVFPYLVSFSYLMLFYSLIILGILQIRQISFLFNIPKNSFRWKITVLIISSLVFALLAMGAGSIWFSVRYFGESTKAQMEEKMNSAHSTLSYHSKFAQKYNDPNFNNLRLLETMNRISNTAQIDINVYRSDGLLLRTTRSEIFDRFLLGTRMNHLAYQEIVYNNKKQYVHRETIGDLTYYSLYSPLFNVDGKLIAIVNIPYFSRQSNFRKDASSIIAAIINIYLLLLIAALFGGVALANSIARPLAEISRKMQLLDISQQPEHIDYNNKDELGILVAAYNKMVDDVNESTRRLAQGEREQAWREMARQIAHEIKNPLTPMRLSIQHMVRLKDQGVKDWAKRFDALANSLIEQIDILSEAAGEFSSFSRFYSEERTRFDLNSLIKEQLILFNTHDHISITFESKVTDAFVLARKTQLTRVFVNLFSNAVQAVENQNSGRILITVERGDKNYIVSVHDDGKGVPESLTHRLFKPNFTTKSGGTGLGLAICRSIMEQSQGAIGYRQSELLGGACFSVMIAHCEP